MSQTNSVFSQEYAPQRETSTAETKQNISIKIPASTINEDDNGLGTGVPNYGLGKPKRIIIRARINND